MPFDNIDFQWLIIGWAIAMFIIFIPVIGFAVNEWMKQQEERDND